MAMIIGKVFVNVTVVVDGDCVFTELKLISV